MVVTRRRTRLSIMRFRSPHRSSPRAPLETNADRPFVKLAGKARELNFSNASCCSSGFPVGSCRSRRWKPHLFPAFYDAIPGYGVVTMHPLLGLEDKNVRVATPWLGSATKAKFLCPIWKYGALIDRRTQDRKRRKANHDDENRSFKSNLFGCYFGFIPPEPSPNLFGDGRRFRSNCNRHTG